MEINNSIPQNSPSKAEQDQKTADLDNRSTPEQASTGVDKKESLVLSDQAKRVQKAQDDLANRPVVDMDRVNQVKQKLQNDGIDLMTKGDASSLSAQKIADKIFEIESQYDKGPTFDE